MPASPFSLIAPLRGCPVAVVDVETTGASAEYGDRVIEIGVARYEGGRIVHEYQQLFDPCRKVGPGITALTGINNAMLAHQPRFVDRLPEILAAMDGAVVVGHNVRFDLSFLHREFRGAGVEMVEALHDAPVLDTVRIARKRFGRGGNGLQRLAAFFNYQPDAAHRALADAKTTGFILEQLLTPAGGWETCLCDAMTAQGGPMALLPKNRRESLLPLELAEALEQKKPVRMEYLDAANRRTFRVIEPLEVRRYKNELTLIAHCQLRNDRRTFKLDRIVALAVMGEE